MMSAEFSASALETDASQTEGGAIDPRELSRLLFMTFIYLADCEKDVTPQEIRNLRKMAANPRWTDHTAMRLALPLLGANYPEFWGGYEAKTLVVSRRGLLAQLRATYKDLDDNQAAALCEALGDFVERFEPGPLSLLGRGALLSSARNRSIAELKAMFAEALEVEEPKRGEDIVVKEITQSPSMAAVDTPHIVGNVPHWQQGRTKLRCVSVKQETADVKSFGFVAEPACLFHYQPGQFVTFELQIDGRTVRRSYTISSSPSRPYVLIVTVKRVPDGVVSNWLHGNMRQGQECVVRGPYGKFSCTAHPNRKLLLLSGGSGITPMMSMLRYLADTAPDADILFINSVRTPSDIIFEKELLFLNSLFGQALRLILLPSKIDRGQAWHGLVGRITAELLPTLAPDFLEREVFVCGPQGLMDIVWTALIERGHQPERIHQEKFASSATPRLSTTAERPPPVQSIAPGAPLPERISDAPSAGRPAEPATPIRPPTLPRAEVSVRFTASGIVAKGRAEDTLLEIAEVSGISVPSSCRAGTCGTCKLRVASGKVSMGPQSALTEEEIAEGFVASCVTHAIEGVVVEA